MSKADPGKGPVSGILEVSVRISCHRLLSLSEFRDRLVMTGSRFGFKGKKIP